MEYNKQRLKGIMQELRADYYGRDGFTPMKLKPANETHVKSKMARRNLAAPGKPVSEYAKKDKSSFYDAKIKELENSIFETRDPDARRKIISEMNHFKTLRAKASGEFEKKDLGDTGNEF